MNIAFKYNIYSCEKSYAQKLDSKAHEIIWFIKFFACYFFLAFLLLLLLYRVFYDITRVQFGVSFELV